LPVANRYTEPAILTKLLTRFSKHPESNCTWFFSKYDPRQTQRDATIKEPKAKG
jgi:hypothetical protein